MRKDMVRVAHDGRGRRGKNDAVRTAMKIDPRDVEIFDVDSCSSGYSDDFIESTSHVGTMKNIKASHHYDYRDQNYTWGPIRRWMISKVGTPWNDVHAEIAAVVKHKTKQEWNVWHQVMWEIERNGVFFHNGVVYSSRFQQPLSKGSLYVDEHGILQRITKHQTTNPWNYRGWQQRQRDEEYKVKRQRPDGTYNECRDGIWYHVTYTETPYYDTIMQWDSSQGKMRPYEVNRVKVTETKRQLNKKELKYYGLRNNPATAVA